MLDHTRKSKEEKYARDATAQNNFNQAQTRRHENLNTYGFDDAGLNRRLNAPDFRPQPENNATAPAQPAPQPAPQQPQQPQPAQPAAQAPMQPAAAQEQGGLWDWIQQFIPGTDIANKQVEKNKKEAAQEAAQPAKAAPAPPAAPPAAPPPPPQTPFMGNVPAQNPANYANVDGKMVFKDPRFDAATMNPRDFKNSAGQTGSAWDPVSNSMVQTGVYDSSNYSRSKMTDRAAAHGLSPVVSVNPRTGRAEITGYKRISQVEKETDQLGTHVPGQSALMDAHVMKEMRQNGNRPPDAEAIYQADLARKDDMSRGNLGPGRIEDINATSYYPQGLPTTLEDAVNTVGFQPGMSDVFASHDGPPPPGGYSYRPPAVQESLPGQPMASYGNPNARTTPRLNPEHTYHAPPPEDTPVPERTRAPEEMPMKPEQIKQPWGNEHQAPEGAGTVLANPMQQIEDQVMSNPTLNPAGRHHPGKSRDEVIRMAAERGLELSEDGQQWMPAGQDAVAAPAPAEPAPIPAEQLPDRISNLQTEVEDLIREHDQFAQDFGPAPEPESEAGPQLVPEAAPTDSGTGMSLSDFFSQPSAEETLEEEQYEVEEQPPEMEDLNSTQDDNIRQMIPDFDNLSPEEQEAIRKQFMDDMAPQGWS